MAILRYGQIKLDNSLNVSLTSLVKFKEYEAHKEGNLDFWSKSFQKCLLNGAVGSRNFNLK